MAANLGINNESAIDGDRHERIDSLMFDVEFTVLGSQFSQQFNNSTFNIWLTFALDEALAEESPCFLLKQFFYPVI
jgi:hypothetical protein